MSIFLLIVASEATDQFIEACVVLLNILIILSHVFLSAEIYDKVEKEIGEMRLKTECLGGDRIQHYRLSDKKILVYGYSVVGFILRIN